MSSRKAIAYCRVSTNEQSRHGVSLEAQEARIRAYCQMVGLELVDVVKEEGVSASIHLSQRPKGRILLQRVQAEGIENIVALKLDRLFRSTIDCLKQTQDWDDQGIALHLIDMGGQAVDTSTAVGRLFLTMTAGFAEMERALIAERTKFALEHKKKNKQVYTSTPYGYDRVGNYLEENTQEQEAIKLMRQLRSQGVSYRQICNKLQEAGIKTKQGKDKWYPSTVRYILENDLNREEELA